MYNYEIKKNSFISLGLRQLGNNNTDFNIMIVHYHIHRKLAIIRYMIYMKYGLEPVLIQRILIGFEP